MAETIPDFNFGSMRHGGGSDYDRFLDGQIWKLTPEDSPSGTANIKSMQTAIANRAKKTNKHFRSNLVTERKIENKKTKAKQYLIVQASEEPFEEDNA